MTKDIPFTYHSLVVGNIERTYSVNSIYFKFFTGISARLKIAPSLINIHFELIVHLMY